MRYRLRMASIVSRLIQPIVLNLAGAFFLAGCAIDFGSYPQAQSLESTVQAVLAQQGYYHGPIDGSVGPTTSRAIANYQSDHRLTPTGTINPALVASMGLAVPQNPGVSSFSTGYSSYYAPVSYSAPPTVIGVGGGWPLAGYGSYWNRGWGGWGAGGGYNHWGNGGYYRNSGNYYHGNYGGNGHGSQGDNDHGNHKNPKDNKHKKSDHKKHGNHN